MIASIVGSIPSPSSGVIHLGSVQLRAYGLMIALGVVAAVWLGGRRLEARGAGTREDMSYIALWAVPAGVIGSRLYHVITDWDTFQGRWLDVFKIWEGGLGIWGGIAVGVPVGIWAARRRGVQLDPGLSAITPALPLAQAIGRWGNWWNQELFGRPTDLPWALRVSPEKAVAAGYPPGTTFHPTFLYESLWNFFLCGALIWIDKRYRPRGTQLFAMYVAGYTFMRFWIERIRIDPANHIGPWRVNEWVSLIVFLAALLYLIFSYRWGRAPEASSADESLAEGSAAVVSDDDDASISGGDIDDEAIAESDEAIVEETVVGAAGVDADAAEGDVADGAGDEPAGSDAGADETGGTTDDETGGTTDDETDGATDDETDVVDQEPGSPTDIGERR